MPKTEADKGVSPFVGKALPPFGVLLLSFVAACPPHEEITPQIAVTGNVLDRFCRLPGNDKEPACAPKKKPPPLRNAARVHPMKKGEELGGSNAIGRAGDIVLENDEVVFVIDQLGAAGQGGIGFAESGGNLVDAADARARKDELGLLFTYFGTFPRQGVYERLTTGTTPDGTAWVEARGHELYEAGVQVTTRYALHPGNRALEIQTTLSNLQGPSAHPVSGLGLGDAVQWGGAEKVAPGKPVGFRGRSSGPYIGGVGREVSYALTSTTGEIAGISGGSWTDTEQEKNVALAPGQSVQYTRVFVVGQRPDTSSLVSELILASGGPALAHLDISLRETESAPAIAPPEDARVSLFQPGGGGEVLGLAARDGKLEGDVPLGTYELAYASGGGRKMAGARVKVALEEGKTAKATLDVTRPGRFTAACVELAIAENGRQNRVPSPCKVTVRGVGTTRSPDFGPAHVSGPAKNQITTHDGTVDVPLAEGAYEITVSRGPEYSIRTTPVTVRAGETATLRSDEATLERVVDTSGYVSTDFHQHTMLGADSPVALHDRVVANAAEGLEIAVASEHNVVADLSGIVRELGLERHLVEIAGDELSTDSSKKPWGHANVFPLPFEPDKPHGGAVVVKDRSARDVFAEIRARNLHPAPVFQINHPRTNVTGYFDQLAFDPKTGAGTGPGYDPDFDALEVWNGRNVDGRDKVLADYFALLRTGHPVTPTADTDTHGIVGHEAGYPRTFVRVTSDLVPAWTSRQVIDLVEGVRVKRDVVLTNGPFLRVSVNGADVGGVAQAKGGKVLVVVHVEHAPWMKVERLRVLSARTGAEIAGATTALRMAPLPSGALGADVRLPLRFAEDDAIAIVVDGTAPMEPVLSGDPKEISPFAMTGAIWIDADGDGRALGRTYAPQGVRDGVKSSGTPVTVGTSRNPR